MRRLSALCLVLAAAGCEHKVSVPTTAQLMTNDQLLRDWKEKCDTGQYSQLPAAEKADMCFTTGEATRSLAIKKINGL